MTDKGLNNRLERKRKLENELTGKISKDWNEFVKKSDEYMKEIQENNRQYYQQQLDKELDDMEKDINSGNTIGAIYQSRSR